MKPVPLISILVAVFLFTGISCGAAIVEFCPDTYQNGEGDEYIVIDTSPYAGGLMVGDGEGSFRFPEESLPSTTVTVAREAGKYRQVHGFFPDFEIYDSSPEVPDVVRTGDLRMANREDCLVLYDRGELIQEVCWPRDVRTREGQIHFLDNGTWDPRPLFIGQSRFSPTIFTGVSGIAFVSPDCSRTIILDTINTAKSSIRLNIYEFTDEEFAIALAGAAGRGVETSVLLEGGPVGGLPSGEGLAALTIMNRGGNVLVMGTTDDAHAKYRYNHAKYLILDNSTVIITSENFKPHSIPPAGLSGNRGWGVLLADPGIAQYFGEVFAQDSTGGDVVPFNPEGSVTDDEPLPDNPYGVEFEPFSFTGATVTPVLSPDTSSLVTDLIRSAGRTIAIEQAYISNWSGEQENPYLSEALDAARRGVSVRILLDSSWFNIMETDDNDEMVEYINMIAAAESLPLEARCADLESNNIEKIHNKGVIVDGQTVLVGSINWNENSPSFNREAAVIIEHPGAASYFESVFNDDWAASEPRANQNYQTGPDSVKLAIALVMIAFFCILAVIRSRR